MSFGPQQPGKVRQNALVVRKLFDEILPCLQCIFGPAKTQPESTELAIECRQFDSGRPTFDGSGKSGFGLLVFRPLCIQRSQQQRRVVVVRRK